MQTSIKSLKLALTSLTSGGRSVGIVRRRTTALEFKTGPAWLWTIKIYGPLTVNMHIVALLVASSGSWQKTVSRSVKNVMNIWVQQNAENFLSIWATIRVSKRTLPRGIISWNCGFIPRLKQEGCANEYHVSPTCFSTVVNYRFKCEIHGTVMVAFDCFQVNVAGICGFLTFLGEESECIVGKPRTQSSIPSRSRCLRTALLTTHWADMWSQVHRVTSEHRNRREYFFRDTAIKTKA
jgi:hypothetical protein